MSEVAVVQLPATSICFDGVEWASSKSSSAHAPVVVIGGGPAGIRIAQELSRRGQDCIVFNAERWQPYNRVKLTPLLCGDAQVGQVMPPLKFSGPGKVSLYSDHSIVDVDRDGRTVTTKVGRIQPYSRLVFATGSRAHVPPIAGSDLDGVYTFRNFDDVEKLIARSFRSRRTVIIGGGLLGLEAARGMANRGIESWVIEHERHLMARQLDSRAGDLLAARLASTGLTVRTGKTVDKILGDGRVEELILADGSTLPCDTVIICTGIRANKELARDIGLPVGRGINVSEHLQTEDPNIYAVGECAEVDGETCGLVGPAFEQATIAARHIAGEDIRYAGSLSATKLKVSGVDVFSMGDVEQLDQRRDLTSLIFDDGGVYRRLVFSRGILVGAIAFGDWSEINRVQELVRTGAKIRPWQRWRFTKTGRLWPEGQKLGISDWPRAATVCNCTGVTRGQIGDAISLGAQTLEEVRRDTGASTVCGSCQVNVSALLGADAPREPVRSAKPLTVLAALAGVLGLLVLLAPVWPMATNILSRGIPEHLWLDGYWKQVSGFTLLGLSIATTVFSLRKRVKWLRHGDFALWRVIHLAVGVFAIAMLFVHTGFRLGENLNFWLMACFLGLSLAGAVAGLTTAIEHKLFATPEPAATARSLSFWLHLIAFWPIPVLLAVHVLSVYYY